MMLPRQRGEPRPGRDAGHRATHSGLGAGAWPEVHETRDALAMMTADTVLQILHGQGLTWGLGAAVCAPPPAPLPPPRRNVRIGCPVCGMNVAARPSGKVFKHRAYECENNIATGWVWCPGGGVQLHPGSISVLAIPWEEHPSPQRPPHGRLPRRQPDQPDDDE
jgi:hypothetical protein